MFNFSSSLFSSSPFGGKTSGMFPTIDSMKPVSISDTHHGSLFGGNDVSHFSSWDRGIKNLSEWSIEQKVVLSKPKCTEVKKVVDEIDKSYDRVWYNEDGSVFYGYDDGDGNTVWYTEDGTADSVTETPTQYEQDENAWNYGNG